MPKSVAVVQSNYIPWKGYFDLINMVDEFILLDDVQYTRRDWRNRNLIKTNTGLKWLTIPVEVSGRYYEKICKIGVSDPKWPRRHWDAIRANYADAVGEINLRKRQCREHLIRLRAAETQPNQSTEGTK